MASLTEDYKYYIELLLQKAMEKAEITRQLNDLEVSLERIVELFCRDNCKGCVYSRYSSIWYPNNCDNPYYVALYPVLLIREFAGKPPFIQIKNLLSFIKDRCTQFSPKEGIIL